MGTLVTEPYVEDVPKFFGMTLEELFAVKDHTAFLDFEHGRIDELTYGARFFMDGRGLDIEGLKAALYASYQWMDGVEALLAHLGAAGYRIHALSNYSVWYRLIEDKLGLSRYLSWSFVSCLTGHRKPDPEAYLFPARALGVSPESCVFIDDRPKNVDGARRVGMPAVLRTPDIDALARDLESCGVRAQG